MPELKQPLIEYMQGIDVIDCHEHLQPESARLEREVDVLTLFSLYAAVDTVSAGLPTEGITMGIGNNLMLDTSVSLKERWDRLWPYLQRTKYGSYFRPTAIALRDLYGIDELGDDNYVEASEKISAANKPGLYRSLFGERCRIKKMLVQNGRIEGQDPAELFAPLFSNPACVTFDHRMFLDELTGKYATDVGDFDAYLECLGRYLEEVRTQGAIGFKTRAMQQPEPDLVAARADFAAWLEGAPPTPALISTALDFVLRRAEEWDWPVAVHCGVWGDYRTVDPKNIIDTVMRYPKVRFDLYHLGMPFVRDCIFIAKSFPNAHLNLCWCYAISEEITRRAIGEILDTVPVNKVFGFGADYIWAAENVYGHLVMARETIAEALAGRIESGRLDMEGAEHICRLWLHDNPAEFYGLK